MTRNTERAESGLDGEYVPSPLERVRADGDYVMAHGRFWNVGQPANRIVADIVRIEDGLLAEPWDVVEDEATAEESQSGLPMFGDAFPTPGRP